VADDGHEREAWKLLLGQLAEAPGALVIVPTLDHLGASAGARVRMCAQATAAGAMVQPDAGQRRPDHAAGVTSVNTVTPPGYPNRPGPEVWEPPEVRAALAARDVTRVYRLLQRRGFSQQRIAALTGQSQPEVSAIIHGRKVMAYEVLSRVADRLGIPAGT
jgi:predicted XRE-type DNA-binding protein